MMAGMIDDRSRLDAALAGLDRAFGPRRGRIAPVDACTHCFDSEELAVLAGPVADIPERLFSHTIFSWGTTMDANVPLWRRLTPRILRQLADGTLHIDESFIARKFGEAGWRGWADDERHAVSEFCEAQFESALTAPSGPNAITVLPFVGGMYNGITHWLQAWSATHGRRADEQLAHLASWWMPDLLSGSLDISFSGELPDIAQELTAWLLAEAPSRLRGDDLSTEDAYCLSQLALPQAQRWR